MAEQAGPPALSAHTRDYCRSSQSDVVAGRLGDKTSKNRSSITSKASKRKLDNTYTEGHPSQSKERKTGSRRSKNKQSVHGKLSHPVEKDRKHNEDHKVKDIDYCVANCTRSKTAHYTEDSKVFFQTADEPTTPSGYSKTLNLLYDYSNSPFSSSSVTEQVDSDYSVYSTTIKTKLKRKKKVSVQRGISKTNHKKFSFLKNLETKRGGKSKIADKHIDLKSIEEEGDKSFVPYSLRSRQTTKPKISVPVASTSKPSTSKTEHSTKGKLSDTSKTKISKETLKLKSNIDSTDKASSQLPYLRPTNARRSAIVALSSNLGSCLTRSGGGQRQRRDNTAKVQLEPSTDNTEGADMPQPSKTSKGKSNAAPNAGGTSQQEQSSPLNVVSVASTSSTQQASTNTTPDATTLLTKGKTKGGWTEDSSSGEEGEVGRLQALLEARGVPPQLLGALGPRVHHLLARSHHLNTAAATKAASLLNGLQATGDEGQQLQAVIEMGQLLVMGNEDTLAGFPVRQVVPALINLLAADDNFDMMNHACRALTYMMEALPRSSGAVVMAVPAFLDKLRAITCMDVAEQSLTALDMLSKRHAKPILQANGVATCLMYLDFFSINAQRAALSITANCCQNLAAEEFHYVKESLPLLSSRLTHQDKKSLELVCQAISRLVDSYQTTPTIMNEIATVELLTNLQQLLVVWADGGVTSGTSAGSIIRALWSVCGCSPALAARLQRARALHTLLHLLTNQRHHLPELTGLAADLMPPLPRNMDPQYLLENPDTGSIADTDNSPDERWWAIRAEGEIIRGLAGALLAVYAACAGPAVRDHCLRALRSILYHVQPPHLHDIVDMQEISSVIAGMLGSSDVRLVIGALLLAEVLITRLPEEAALHFRREGVVHQVTQLANSQSPATMQSQTSPPHQEYQPQPQSTSSKSASEVTTSSSTTSTASTPSHYRSSNPLQLAEMLRKKRTKRVTAPVMSRHMPQVEGSSRAKSSSFLSSLSSLHPARWARSRPSEPDVQQNRRAAREWVRRRAATLGSRLAGGSGGVGAGEDGLTRLSSLAEGLRARPLRALQHLKATLTDHHVSPFEVNQSGMIGVLLEFLTAEESDRDSKLRMFLNIFAGLPLNDQWEDNDYKDVSEARSGFTSLVESSLAVVAQLEQFPVRVHELPAHRHNTSALKFFNTHQLTCDLKRHPECTDLKQWKGGVVRIDPLALVQAIERYLATRGYARTCDGSDEDVSDEDLDSTQLMESEHKLEFLIGETVLPYNMTVYQAIRQYGDHSDTDTDTEAPLGNAGIWSSTHTIYYRSISQSPPLALPVTRKGKGNSSKNRRKHDTLWNEGIVPVSDCPLRSRLCWNWAVGGINDPSSEALRLLRTLNIISRYWSVLYAAPNVPSVNYTPNKPILPSSCFLSNKLTAKANRQLQDPLVIMTGNLPSWLQQVAYGCPFVFPFESRLLIFYAVSFDRERALQRVSEGGVTGAGGSNGPGTETTAPRLERRRRTVARDHLLRQAERLLAELRDPRPLLEVQYEGEVGTGLGPTLEFYALVSRELQKAELELWHGSEDARRHTRAEAVKSPVPPTAHSTPPPQIDAALVSWSCGLFPQALARNLKGSALSRIKAKFRFLGKFMAKAVMDSRMLDLPLSIAFYRWMIGEERSMDLNDVCNVAPELWRSLDRLRIVARSGGGELDGVDVEELSLDMQLPGARGLELYRGGRDIPVTRHNLAQYVDLVAHWMLREGVQRQMDAFKEGFDSIFPMDNLKIFYPEELEMVFCGSPTDAKDTRWDLATLTECIRTDHGYTADSRAIRMLLDILSTYDYEERRLFLQFVTGSPRLPTGGLKALNPPLTVVRKTTESSSDGYLPSVMTCVNYLKLPDYSSRDVMRERLRLAAVEGQHSFHLS